MMRIREWRAGKRKRKEKRNMNRIDNYKKYFTKEYMMGPNALRLLDEILLDNPRAISGGRVLDLGCGAALSSLLLAKETDADSVYALDLWVSPTDNWKRICANGLEEKIIPIYGDALAMPFAEEFFDTIVSIDTYHYFGCEEKVFGEKILPFLKKGGYALIVVPGVKQQPEGEMKVLMEEWAGEDTCMFQTCKWWEEHLTKGFEEQVEVRSYESSQFDLVWKEWTSSGHEYGIRDEEYLEKGLKNILNFVMLVIKKKETEQLVK